MYLLCAFVIHVIIMDFISFRTDRALKEEAELLAELENKNKSEEYRDIFLTGLQEKKKEMAIQRYQRGELSLGKAAELANLAILEFPRLLKEKNVPINKRTFL